MLGEHRPWFWEMPKLKDTFTAALIRGLGMERQLETETWLDFETAVRVALKSRIIVVADFARFDDFTGIFILFTVRWPGVLRKELRAGSIETSEMELRKPALLQETADLMFIEQIESMSAVGTRDKVGLSFIVLHFPFTLIRWSPMLREGAEPKSDVEPRRHALQLETASMEIGVRDLLFVEFDLDETGMADFARSCFVTGVIIEGAVRGPGMVRQLEPETGLDFETAVRGELGPKFIGEADPARFDYLQNKFIFDTVRRPAVLWEDSVFITFMLMDLEDIKEAGIRGDLEAVVNMEFGRHPVLQVTAVSYSEAWDRDLVFLRLIFRPCFTTGHFKEADMRGKQESRVELGSIAKVNWISNTLIRSPFVFTLDVAVNINFSANFSHSMRQPRITSRSLVSLRRSSTTFVST